MTKEELEKQAEKYAREMWGVYYDDLHPDSAINDCIGELTKKDYIAGFEAASLQKVEPTEVKDIDFNQPFKTKTIKVKINKITTLNK